jgi:prepilin-type N-terminal cleavage/methylation domain-containing protein
MGKRQGFTLIELLVVIAIIAILAAISVSGVRASARKGASDPVPFESASAGDGI